MFVDDDMRSYFMVTRSANHQQGGCGHCRLGQLCLARWMVAVLVSLLLVAGCSRSNRPLTQASTPSPTVATQTSQAVAATPTDMSTRKSAGMATTVPASSMQPTGTTAPPPTSTPLPPEPTPSPTVAPTEAATPFTATVQASQPVAVVIGPGVNVRQGPGIGYPSIGQATEGQRYSLVGRYAADDWWQIDFNGTDGWVYGPLIGVEGDAAQLAVTQEMLVPPPRTRSSVQVYETTITLPTYPYDAFTEEATNPAFNWTYHRFDGEAYRASNPQPAPKTYTLVVLENEYLRITLLPELGGRIYQVIFKPTGSNEFYQNPVVKPSPWGPPEQGGWLAVGGLEWGLPVEEHGYVWGESWGHITLPLAPDEAGVTVFMPAEGHLRAEVDIFLRSGEAFFRLRPRIVNPSSQELAYKFWLNAMLAPGPVNTVSPQLRFHLPTSQVTIHSRGDDYLPAAGQPMEWPVFDGRDYGQLGNWNGWLGFFERPAAHGPFVAVYDASYDEGMVRVYPSSSVPGSKGFGFGWADAIGPENYTDDSSAYVELHGGVAPTFWDQATLPAGETVTWEERWFPVAGIGGVSYAEDNGALYLEATVDELLVGLFPVRAVLGYLRLSIDEQVFLEEAVKLSPAQPFYRALPLDSLPSGNRVRVVLLDQNETVVLDYELGLDLP